MRKNTECFFEFENKNAFLEVAHGKAFSSFGIDTVRTIGEPTDENRR